MRNKLLFRALAGENKFEAITNQAGTEATLYVYDEIVGDDWEAEWGGGVSSKKFIETLNGLSAPVIHLRINSPGGDVFAARTMETAIKNHASKVIAYIDGLAASAASILAIAADEVVIAPGGFFMIHNASMLTWGNKEELAQKIDVLTKVDDSLADTYVAKTGQEKEKIAEMMNAETWIGSADAVEQGFADSVMEYAVKNSIKWDLSAFENAPDIGQVEPEPEPVIEPVVVDEQDAEIKAQERKRNFEFALLC